MLFRSKISSEHPIPQCHFDGNLLHLSPHAFRIQTHCLRLCDPGYFLLTHRAWQSSGFSIASVSFIGNEHLTVSPAQVSAAFVR